jgi:Recombination endonuclease VII
VVTPGGHQRAQNLKRRYNLSPQAYQAILEAQDGRCGICRGIRRYNLHVDHDHLTGRVRGLLCKTCNRRLLPATRDGLLLEAAAAYLASPPAARVLAAEARVPGYSD